MAFAVWPAPETHTGNLGVGFDDIDTLFHGIQGAATILERVMVRFSVSRLVTPNWAPRKTNRMSMAAA